LNSIEKYDENQNVWKIIQLQLNMPIEGGVVHLINDNEFIYIGGLIGGNKVNILYFLML